MAGQWRLVGALSGLLHAQLAWNSSLFHAILIGIALLYGLALAWLSPLNAFLLLFFSLVGVGTLLEPLVGLLVTLWLGVLWAWLRAELSAVPPLIAMPVLALTLASWLMQGAAQRRVRLRRAPLLVPLLLFIGVGAFSLWDGVELTVYGLPELVKWLQVLALFWLVVDTVDQKRLTWLVAGLLAIGLFQAAVGLWQFGLRGTGPEHFAIPGAGFFRAYGTFEQPNPYAGYLGLVLPLGIGLLANGALGVVRSRKAVGLPNPRLLAVLLAVCALTGAALLASWSRGAWLGMGVALLAMAVALPGRAWVGVGLIGVLLVGLLGLGALDRLPASVEARLTDFTQYVRFEGVRGVGINDANYAVLERLAHWQAALEMWRANFWNGVGLGDYEPAYADYALLNWPIPLGHAHNVYLNVAAETGTLGLATYLLLWGAVFWHTWRLTRRLALASWQRGLAVGLLGAWTHFSVHHLFDNLYVNNVHLHVGVMLGLVAAISIRSRSRPCAGPNPPPERPSVGRS